MGSEQFVVFHDGQAGGRGYQGRPTQASFACVGRYKAPPTNCHPEPQPRKSRPRSLPKDIDYLRFLANYLTRLLLTGYDVLVIIIYKILHEGIPDKPSPTPLFD